jgi:hypothetical protein
MKGYFIVASCVSSAWHMSKWVSFWSQTPAVYNCMHRAHVDECCKSPTITHLFFITFASTGQYCPPNNSLQSSLGWHVSFLQDSHPFLNLCIQLHKVFISIRPAGHTSNILWRISDGIVTDKIQKSAGNTMLLKQEWFHFHCVKHILLGVHYQQCSVACVALSSYVKHAKQGMNITQWHNSYDFRNLCNKN